MPELIEPEGQVVSETFGEVPIKYPDAEAWKYQIDTADVLEELAHHLRGEFKTVKKVADVSRQLVDEVSWEKKGKKLLNDEGIRFVVTFVGGHLSKVHTLTDIDEEQVHRMAREMYIDLAVHFSLHHKSYECDEFPLDTTTMTLLIDFIDHYIFANLCRGMDGRFLRYLKPSIERKEIVRGIPEEKKRSLLPFI